MSEQGSSSTNSNPRILIVDDLPSARKILSKLLQRAGFSNFIQSSDGAEALSILQKEKVDIVISDWHMPSMDGLALKNAMDEDENLSEIPFILITSSNELDDVEEALEAGVSDYICKPFTLDVINQKINKYISPSSNNDA